MIKKIVLTFLSIITVLVTNAQFARMQFANNCPDVALTGIDIYVNGTLLLTNINFRTASPFIDVLPGNSTISVAPPNSTSVNDAFYSTTLLLTPQDTLVAVANGTQTSTGYSPYIPFGLSIFTSAREMAYDIMNAEMLFINGSTDAGIIDVRSGIDTWVDNLGIGNVNGYYDFTQSNNIFRITNSSGSQALNTYNLLLLPQWIGQAGIILTSGFINPANNNNGTAFETFVVFANGGPFTPVTATAPEAYARLQLIHNSADVLADTVDVYVNSQLILDDVPYLTSTEYMDAPVNLQLEIGVAPMNSTSVTDTFYNLTTTFDSAGVYVLAAQGIESTSGYNPAPPFELKRFNNAKETTTANNTSILFTNGSTDMPGFDIEQGSNTWVNDLYYGDFSTSYYNLPTADVIINFNDGATSTLINKYKAQLQALGFGGKTTTLVASGFKNPGNNNNGTAFGLYFATSEGGALIPLPIEPVSVTDINKDKSPLTLYPNPANDVLHINAKNGIKDANVIIYDITGKNVLSICNIQTNGIDISTLQNGMYFLELKGTGDITYSKFIKQ